MNDKGGMLSHFLKNAYNHNTTNGDYVFILVDAQSQTYHYHKSTSAYDKFEIGNVILPILNSLFLNPKWVEAVVEALKRCLFLSKWMWHPNEFDDFKTATQVMTKRICTARNYTCVSVTLPIGRSI